MLKMSIGICFQILTGMQSIDSLVCYGKRVCAFRIGVKNVYDQRHIKPTVLELRNRKILQNLWIFLMAKKK